jgi:hypothetical protein
MATARRQPSASPSAAGPSGVRHSPSPARTPAPDFFFNAPAELPIQEEDEPDPDPEDDPDPIDPPDPEMDLAQALQLLANKIGGMPSQKSKSSIKPRVPDTFDGSDPNKLEAFLFQCQMYLAVRSGDFPDDESKVTFILSYLKGSPQDWFQSELNHAMISRQLPDWFASYRTFIEELQRLFGPRDPITDAMNSLESLKLKDSGKATKYTIDFNRYARKTGWNEQALSRQFYKNLPDRLKDEIARIGKPAALKTLQDLVATLDQRYWERQSEINRDKKSSNSNSTPANKSTASDNRSGGQQSSGSKQDNRQQQRNKDQQKPTASTSATPDNKLNPIANLLGPDGKLTAEERKRRLDNKLCLRCGKIGHMVSDCPQRSKAKDKARAATVSTPATAPAAPAGSGKV